MSQWADKLIQNKYDRRHWQEEIKNKEWIWGNEKVKIVLKQKITKQQLVYLAKELHAHYNDHNDYMNFKYYIIDPYGVAGDPYWAMTAMKKGVLETSIDGSSIIDDQEALAAMPNLDTDFWNVDNLPWGLIIAFQQDKEGQWEVIKSYSFGDIKREKVIKIGAWEWIPENLIEAAENGNTIRYKKDNRGNLELWNPTMRCFAIGRKLR